MPVRTRTLALILLAGCTSLAITSLGIAGCAVDHGSVVDSGAGGSYAGDASDANDASDASDATDGNDASNATMTTTVNGFTQVRHIERQPY